MTKKQIIWTAFSAIVLLFALSWAIVSFPKQKELKEVFYATPTIVRDYTKHIKSFPAPYPEVNLLPWM